MSTQLNIPFDTSPGHTAANALTGHDPASFASLYDRNWAMVWRFAYLRTGDRHAAEDVLHDVFLALLKAAPTFQERGIPIEHWLLRVSNRCCTRWLYKNRWRKRFGFVRADSCEMPAQENCDIVCAVMRLPDELREVTLLHYIHSLPLAAVSSVIERPIGTVKSRLSRTERYSTPNSIWRLNMTTNPDETLESRLRLAALNVEPDRRASSRVKERLMSNFVKRPSVWRSPLVLVLGVLGVSAVAYAGVRTVVIPLLNNSLLASSGSSGTPVVAEPLPAGMSTNVSKRERPNVVHAWKVTMPDGSTKLVTPPTVTLPDGTVVPNTPDR